MHRVGEAVRRAVPTERLYVLSLGSRQGNAARPPAPRPAAAGLPDGEQQLAALDCVRAGVLDLDAAELDEPAAAIRRDLA